MTDETLTTGIDPDSRCRLPLPHREALSARGREVYEQLADPAGDSLVGLQGPGGIRLHSPEIAWHMREMHRYFRGESPLPARLREVAILVTARAHDSAFEWAAHEPQALRDGVDPATVEAIRGCGALDGIDADDALVIRLGRELFGNRRVGDALYAEALDRFGPSALVDLISLMGLYAATAALLAAFEMQLPPGVSDGLASAS